MSKQRISSTDLRKYRTELPNLYDDANLNPYEFRLLSHYVRVGNCYEGTRTTAKKCKMSVGKVSETRKSLKDKNFILMSENTKTGTIQIEVIDRWAENFEVFTTRTERSPHEHQRSPGEQKKEPIKNKQIKKLTSPKEGEVVEPEYVPIGDEFEQPPKSNHKPLVGELSKVTGFDIKMHGSRLGKAAKKLGVAGYTPKQVKAAFGKSSAWYSRDWRGKKGDKPTPEMVVEQIKNMLVDERSKYTGGEFKDFINK